MVIEIAVGQRVRRNFWADRRESGWHYGTVTSEPVMCYGIRAYYVQWDCTGMGESLSAADLLEVIEDSVELNLDSGI
jgi:hypothetical protein